MPATSTGRVLILQSKRYICTIIQRCCFSASAALSCLPLQPGQAGKCKTVQVLIQLHFTPCAHLVKSSGTRKTAAAATGAAVVAHLINLKCCSHSGSCLPEMIELAMSDSCVQCWKGEDDTTHCCCPAASKLYSAYYKATGQHTLHQDIL